LEDTFCKVVQATCEDIGSPRALAVSMLVRAGEWAQLAKLRVRPRNYECSEAYWRDCLVTDMLRKCDLPSGIDKEAVAVQTFLDCERENCRTNARLSCYLEKSLFLSTPQEVAVYNFIVEWRKEIKSVLGSIPDTLTPRFSQGSTYADVGKLITPPDKMSSRPTIYAKSRDVIMPFWGTTLWARSLVSDRSWYSDPQSVPGNIFFTVPKDGLTFRGCCKESSLNVAFQLDAGRVIRGKLRKIGIDLLTGKETHMRLARAASVSDADATIDMSNASDTLCRVLPELVLPTVWYDLLNSLRATRTQLKGRWYRLEKFSSMGNGFTFELETLIFATLARTVIRLSGGDPARVTCYGDDLIVPTEYYREITSGLRLFGFTPNMGKTFAEGPFRESCGGDYWRGVPVRGLFVETLPSEPQHWIALANGLRRVAMQSPEHSTERWNLVRRAWFRALDPIPLPIRRCRGPVYLGDIVIHDDIKSWNWSEDGRDLNPSWDTVAIRAYFPVAVVLPWHHWKPSVQLASCTLGLSSDGVTPRGGISGYRIATVHGVLPSIPSPWLPRTSSVRG
jgi:hypothetical protein